MVPLLIRWRRAARSGWGTYSWAARFRQSGSRKLSSQLLLQLVKHLVARQHLRHARIRLPPFADRGNELAVLQLDAVHRHIDLRHVDLFFLAVEEIVVARDVRCRVADVAEEGAQRPFVVE